jgi:ribosomal protein S8E
MYKVIADIDELKFFYDNVLEKPKDNESIMIMHSARAKKLTPEEKQEYALGRAEMFHTEISKKRMDEEYTWIDFLSTVSKLEVNENGYLTKNKKPYPAKVLVSYIYMNPSSEAAVAQDTLNRINTINAEIFASVIKGSKSGVDESLAKLSSISSHIKSCHAAHPSRKVWIDFDADIDNLSDEEIKMIDQTTVKFFGGGNHFLIKTSGGIHILARREALKFNPNNFINALEENFNTTRVKEIKKNDNNMIPIPGTYQYGNIVRIIK